jgi:hypothetical protein
LLQCAKRKPTIIYATARHARHVLWPPCYRSKIKCQTDSETNSEGSRAWNLRAKALTLPFRWRRSRAEFALRQL